MNTEQNKPTVAFKTLGCRLNQAETAIIKGQFISAGYKTVPFGEPADVSIIHSCSITANAEHKSLKLARASKKNSESQTVIIAGCAVEHGDITALKKTGADIIAGQKDKYKLLDLLPPSKRQYEHNSDTAQKPAPHFQTTRALIKIQDGCDFKCAYCVVPSTRGHTTNRIASEIINEVKSLTKVGFKEIILTGANLGCYNDNGKNLIDLIIDLESIPKLLRIRISSIESTTVEKKIIDHMAQSEKLCQYLHIPLQSGSNRILKSMRRRYSAEQYKDLIMYAAEKMPHAGIGTDIIVGYPGEEDEHFNETYALIKELPFSNLHVFPYSTRQGTPAAIMPNHIDNTTKQKRTAKLTELGEIKKSTFAASFIGRTVSMLAENTSSEGSPARGWTKEYVQAEFQSCEIKKNEIINFIPSSTTNNTLKDAN